MFTVRIEPHQIGPTGRCRIQLHTLELACLEPGEIVLVTSDTHPARPAHVVALDATGAELELL